MAANAIPEIPEELSADWLSEALGTPVSDVEREILGQGQGFLGDIVRLHLSSDGTLPETVIAKLPKKANRAMGEMLGVYEREVLFFDELGASVPVRTPRIYFSHYDPDAGSEKQKEILGACDGLPRFMTPVIGYLGKKIAAAKNRRYLLIMEDLGAFEPCDQFAGADAAFCGAVLEQFAPAHRAFWNDATFADRFWLLPMDIDARMREGMFRQTLPRFLAEADENLKPYVSWIGEHYAELTHRLTEEAPTTLLHCDLRLDNVCSNGSECAYLDWQLTRSGPAAYDVAYFIGSALHADTSAAAEDECLARYHRALDVADYDFARFRRDYERGLLLALTSVMPSDDFAIDAGRGQEMMARWRARLAARLQRVDVTTLL